MELEQCARKTRIIEDTHSLQWELLQKHKLFVGRVDDVDGRVKVC